MALECAQCGHRTNDEATRCPSCLRASTLVEVRDAPTHVPLKKRLAANPKRLVAIVLALAFAAGGGTLALLRPRTGASAQRGAARPLDARRLEALGVSREALPPLFALGAASSSLAELARAAGTDPLARARAVGDRLAGLRRAARPDDSPAEAPPPARSLEITWLALTRGEPVTSLDLARLAVGALRAAGTAEARVAERTFGLRTDEPADPTGVRGAYVALVADHALDAGTDAPMQRARDAGAQPIDDAALEGAALAQSALHAALAPSATPRRAYAVALADAAVYAWPEGMVPLAARALVWHALGVSAGRGDPLSSARGVRDETALYVLGARFAIAAGDATSARQSAQVALRRAPRWGPAALLSAALDAQPGDAGDRCAALGAAREPWTDDAFLLCRSASAPSDAERTAAATRLRDSSRDPLRLAYAAAHGAADVLPRVPSYARDEYGLWLRVLGRGDLARALGDAGAPSSAPPSSAPPSSAP